jgi:hypothetical protein
MWAMIVEHKRTMSIQRSTLNLGRLAFAALGLSIALAGCGPAGRAPAGSAGPTQTPASAPTTQPAPAAPTSAPTTQPAPAAPTSAPTTQPAPAAPTTPPPTSAPTNAPATQAQPAAPAPTVAPSATSESEPAAIQTVLDYYDAINQRAYDRAYHLWAQNGAASQQTFDQFAKGFDGTTQVSVQIGRTSAQGGAVTVPIAIASVVEVTNQEQQVRRFQGSYTVQLGANGWRLASAKIAEVSGNTPPPADVGDPLALLQAYYAAINERALGRAYTYWNNNGAASQQSFTQFSQGFATTDHVTIDAGKPQIGGAAGSIYAEAPIVIMATQKDGSQQSFCGTYTLRRLNVPPFDQLGWRIERASIAPITSVQPGSDAEKRLLTNGCQP